MPWEGLAALIVRFPLCSFANMREDLDSAQEKLAESWKYSSDMDSDPTSG